MGQGFAGRPSYGKISRHTSFGGLDSPFLPRWTRNLPEDQTITNWTNILVIWTLNSLFFFLWPKFFPNDCKLLELPRSHPGVRHLDLKGAGTKFATWMPRENPKPPCMLILAKKLPYNNEIEILDINNSKLNQILPKTCRTITHPCQSSLLSCSIVSIYRTKKAWNMYQWPFFTEDLLVSSCWWHQSLLPHVNSTTMLSVSTLAGKLHHIPYMFTMTILTTFLASIPSFSIYLPNATAIYFSIFRSLLPYTCGDVGWAAHLLCSLSLYAWQRSLRGTCFPSHPDWGNYLTLFKWSICLHIFLKKYSFSLAHILWMLAIGLYICFLCRMLLRKLSSYFLAFHKWFLR